MTRFALTNTGEKALANADAAKYICPKIVAAQTDRPLHEIYDAIYNGLVSWTIDSYGNVGVDSEEIPRLRETITARQ